MTCIVGLVAEGKVLIGGDSAGVDERYALTVRADRKVFRNGPFLMGFTSSFRMGQLLAHAFRPPQRYPDQDLHAFMVTAFVDEVRRCLKDGGFARKENEVESAGAFLVGYEGRLFHVDGDYQVGENAAGFAACGCGDLIAMGSLFSTKGRPSEERILQALAAAEAFSAGVRAPFHIIGG